MSAPFSRKLAILAAALVCTVSPLRADEPVDDRIAVRKAVLLAFDYISTNGKSVTSPVWASATPFKGDGPYAMSWFAAAKDALKPQSRNVKRIQIDEDKAWAYLTYEMETPPKSARFVQYEAIFRLVRDGQDWKLWSATEPYIDLCRVLDQAKDAEERLAVLKCHKQWATVFLVVKLNQLAFQDLRVKKLAGATRWNELAFEAAAFVPDRQSEAWCRLNRGLIGEERKKYADAQADFEEALKGFRATGQIQGESIALLHLGRVLAAREDYAKAKAQFDAAKELLDDLGYSVPMNDRVDGVTAWTFNLLDEQARLNERILDHFAAEEFAAAVPLFASLKNVEQTIFGAVSVDLTESLLNEAYARARLGELEEAAVLAEKAAAIHAKLCGSRDGRTRYSLLQAGVHRKLAGFSADERRRFWDALLKVQRSQKQLQQITRKEMSKFQEARKLLEEAVETYRSLKLADSHLNALALQQLGSALAGLDERETAEKILRQAVAICRPILPPESPQCKAGLDQLCALLDIRVVTALKLDDQNAARRLQEEILTIRTFQHGKKHHSILKPRWMLEHILRLADLAPEQRRRVRDAQDILTTGDLARTSGVIDLKRITAMKQAANDLRAILGEEDCIVYQANWSIIDELSNNNCFRDATPFLERQLVSLQRNGGKALGHPDYWNYLCRTAVRTILDGDLRLAEDLFLRTIEMLKQDGLSGSPEYQMVSLALQALYQVMDDMDKAAAHLFPLLQKLKREIFGSRARGSGTARLFNITWARNKSPQLLERLAVTYRTIGHSYYRNHLTSEAESIFQEVARIWHFLGPAWKNSYGGTLIDLAQVHVSQGRLKEAEAEFDEARGLLGDTFEIVRARAWLLCRLKKFDEAREFMLQQLQKNEENPLDFMLWLNQFFLEDLLIIEQATRRDEAMGHLLRLLAIQQKTFRNLPAFQSEQRMQAMLDNDKCLDHLLSMALDDPKSADRKNAALTWVLRRRGLIIETLCQLREDWQLVGLDPELGDKADRLRDLRERWNELAISGRIGDLVQNRDLKAIKGEIEQLEATLNRALSRKRPDRFRKMDEIDPQHVRLALPTDAVLVEFVKFRPFDYAAKDLFKCWRPAHYAALILPARPDAPIQMIDLGEAATIEPQIAAVRNAIAGYPEKIRISGEEILEKDYRKTARTLHDTLFAPLREAIGPAKTLCIVPDGDLHGIPFAALVDEKDRYLIETRRFAYLSSGRDLVRTRSAAEGKGVVIFAGPDFELSAEKRVALLPPSVEPTVASTFRTRGPSERGSGKGWLKLDDAEKEEKSIRRLLADPRWGPIESFVGPKALEENLKKVQSPRILHLATHGFYYPRQKSDDTDGIETRLRASDNPLLRSGLVLAGANAWREKAPDGTRLDDGWVTAEEIALLNLRGTELVVLSACESGLGDVKTGEGVYGLRRAFLHAGARSIVTSLFQVPDEETSVLMEAFYGNLAAGKKQMDSLHQAQQDLLEKRKQKNRGIAHPFFWASFIYIGEP